MTENEEESSVLKIHLCIFEWLKWVSPFKIANECLFNGEDDKRRVEKYVVSLTILSFILILSWSHLKQLLPEWFLLLIVFLGAIRVIEILVVQVNALFYDFYRKTKNSIKLKGDLKPYVVQGYVRITILLLHNIAEITFWFAIFYLNFPTIFIFSQPLNPITALTFSFFTMTTFGFPLQPTIPQATVENYLGYSLILIQAVIGLFTTLLIISRFISLLRGAPSSDPVEKRMKEEENAI